MIYFYWFIIGLWKGCDYMTYNENAKISRMKYEKKHLKRIPLDLNIEKEYKPLKEYCDRNNLTVNGFIRKLIRDAIGNTNYDV